MVEIVDRVPAVAGMRRISWGAIIAGTILTLVVQIMLALLGFGIGLATVDPAAHDSPTLATFTSAGGIWTVLTVLIATFVGGYAAARFAGSVTRRDGALHGITTWATATLVVIYLLASGVSAAVTGAFGALGSSVQTIGQAAGAVIPNSIDSLPPELQADARNLLARGQQQAQQTGQQIQDQAQDAANDARQATGTQDLGAAAREIFAGLGEDATPEQRQAAVQVISSQAGISQQEAEQRLAQFQTRYDQAMDEARQAATKASETLSTTAFVAFIGLLLGLIVAAIGGMVGRPGLPATATATTYYDD